MRLQKGLIHVFALLLAIGAIILFVFFSKNAGVLGTTTIASADSASISASPNPCILSAPKTTCSTTVSWTLPQGQTADICVSPNGGAEQLFASTGKSGSKDATWIYDGAKYTFNLRVPSGKFWIFGGTKCTGTIASSVGVTSQVQQTSPTSITASPNPCTLSAPKTTCSTTISWTLPQGQTADICVSPNGGKEQLFASVGKNGSKEAPWIYDGATYYFKLRVPSGKFWIFGGTKCTGKVVSTVNVTGKKVIPKYFRYEMRLNPSEYFIVKMIDQEDIDIAMKDLNSSTYQQIVIGVVQSGNGGFNNWSWHLDPKTINFGDNAIEVCDGSPAGVERDLSYWLGKAFCPWHAVVSAVYDNPPSKI